MALTITSANSVLMLTILGLYPATQIGGFGPDEAYAFDPIDTMEHVMGVDGNLSAGLIYNAVPVMVSVMPDSPSSQIFEGWRAAELSAGDKLVASGTVSMKSIARKYSLTKVYLNNFPAAPTAGRVLRVRKFGLIVGSVSPAPQ